MLEPINEGITVADLALVRECAGSPGPVLKRFVPEASSPVAMLLQTPAHLRGTSSDGTNGAYESPSFTLSPQSALKPQSLGADSQHGSSYGRNTASVHSSASPPVAVYSYATSAGSSGSSGRSSAFPGRPPRADRGSFKPGTSLPHSRPKTAFGSVPGNATKTAIKFTGAGFRAARDEYLDKVLDFMFKEASDAWVSIKGKQGVSGRCRKPVTMPETYLEFFDSHRDKFELNAELTKVRLRDHIVSRSSDSEDTNVDSLSDKAGKLSVHI